jgi:hypothetical protein
MKLNKIQEIILLSTIVIIALIVRLYRIDEPLADWHSWRQADTSAVTRRFVQDGIDLLHPKYYDLSDIPSGKNNPNGYRMVEFPFINALTALFVQALPSLTLEIWGRLVSIGFSLGSIVILARIVKREMDSATALVSAFIFSVLPFNIYFHRTILPEIPLLFFSLVSMDFFLEWLDTQKKQHFIISLVSAQLALLLKPYFLLFTLPLIFKTYEHYGFKALKNKYFYLYSIFMLLPFLLWRLWILQYPEGIPANLWLFNGTGIRFRPAFFRWIFAERIAKLITGYWGLILFAFGLLISHKKQKLNFFISWLVAVVLYLFIFATGNVTHDYYQIIIIPPIAVMMAKGITAMFSGKIANINVKTARITALICLIFSLGFSWYHIRDYFNINHPEIVRAGQIANVILPKEAKVIAPYGGDTAFLYQINRKGWPIGGGIEDKIEKGATDYVTVIEDDESKKLSEQCKPSISIEGVTIINLRNCNL